MLKGQPQQVEAPLVGYGKFQASVPQAPPHEVSATRLLRLSRPTATTALLVEAKLAQGREAFDDLAQGGLMRRIQQPNYGALWATRALETGDLSAKISAKF